MAILAGGARVALAPRDAALLAWLALEGPTPRAKLAALLWPRSGDEAARNTLRQRVFQLKRQCGDLVVGGTTLALAGDVTHDLASSDSLLGELQIPDAPELAAWLGREREQRWQTRLDGLARQAQQLEDAGELDAALDAASHLLAGAPLSEAAHRRLIRLHYLRGDRSAALLAFDRCERVLKDEVGARPSESTLSLLRTIAAADAHARLPVPTTAAPAALQRPPHLVGRDAIREALRRAVHEGRVAGLDGEAGIGKTRLLADLLEHCSDAGVAVLAVGARPGDALLPHALAARWLQALLMLPGVHPGESERHELARLLPALGQPVTAPDDRGERLRQALHAMLRLAVARGLRAVIIDDLHFADPASLALLQPLVDAGVCGWVLAMRGHELDPAVRDWVDALMRGAAGLPLELRPLDAQALEALLESLAVPGIAAAVQADSLWRHTGGNPLFVLETLREAMNQRGMDGSQHAHWRWPVAPTVQHLIRQRLARLSPLALKLARCAAIAGPDLGADLAAAVLGLRALDLADAWTELERADVLRDSRFAHDLIGEAARSAVPEPIARSLHAEVARWLEQHDGAPARIAGHWSAGGDPGRSVPHLLRAAQQAHAAWQGEQAAALWDRAADMMRDAGDRRGAFDALIRAAHALSEVVVDARLERFAQALVDLADDEGQAAAAALVRLTLLVEAQRFDEALQGAERALAQARRAGRTDVEVELLWDLTVIHWEQGRLSEAAESAQAGLRQLERVDSASALMDLEVTRPKMLHALGSIYSVFGRFAEGNRCIEQSRALALRDGHAATAAFDAASLADNAVAQGDLQAAQHHSAAAEAEARSASAGPSTLARVLKTRAHVLALAGDLGAALALLDEATSATRSGTQRYGPLIHRHWHWLQFELGRRDLALKGLRKLRAEAGLPHGERLLVEACLLHLGEALDAVAMLDRLSSLDNMSLRAQLLCLVEPVCDAERVLPLLSLTAAAAREHGAHGLWVGLQTHRMAALGRLGRDADALEAARSVWQRLEAGVAGIELFPRTAYELYRAWLAHDEDMARVVSLRASSWMRRAAAGLPSSWRENYLARAPAIALARITPS